MRGHPDLLGLRALNVQNASGACRAAPREITVLLTRVIQRQVVVIMPACGVFAEHGLLEQLMVVIDVHEEEAIVGSLLPLRMLGLDRGFALGGPRGARVGPGAPELVEALRVAQLDQPDVTVRDVGGTEDDVRVVLDESFRILTLVIAAGRRRRDHVINCVVLVDPLPERDCLQAFLVRPVDLLVPNAGRRAPMQCAKGVHRVAGHDVLVVAVVLGEGLLQNGHPESLVGPDMSEEGIVAVAPLLHRQPVVDYDGVLDAQRPDIDAVDAVRAEAVGRVEEDLLQAVWNLSDCGSARQEPAVADVALAHVVGFDPLVAEQTVRGEDLADALPVDTRLPIALSFAHVMPEESIQPREVRVVVRRRALVDVIEGRKILLVPILGSRAIAVLLGLSNCYIGDLSQHSIRISCYLGIGASRGPVDAAWRSHDRLASELQRVTLVAALVLPRADLSEATKGLPGEVHGDIGDGVHRDGAGRHSRDASRDKATQLL